MKDMYKFRVVMALFALLFLVGCGNDDSNSSSNNGDEDQLEVEMEVEEEIPPYTQLPVALCGMPSYTLLDPAELGQVVDWEEVSVWDQTAESINNLLASFDMDVLGAMPYGSKLYRFRYTTQDRGKKVEATALLGIPVPDDGETLDEALPTIINTHGTTGFSDPCAPSHPNNELEYPALTALFAALGHVVVAPDYIGMNGFGDSAEVRHGYLVGEQTAIGSLDAVRAGWRLLETQFSGMASVDGRVIPWGGSQGGHAALFVEHIAPYYAPEFEVPAVLALIPPTSLVSLLESSVTGILPGTGLVGISLVTMHLWYGEQVALSEVMTNEDPYYFADNAPTLIFPKEECELDIDVDLENASVDLLFSENLLEKAGNGQLSEMEPWACFYEENSLTDTSVPRLRTTPTLIVTGETDDLVTTSVVRDDVVKLCNDGYRIQYLECAGAGHVEAALWSLPEQVAWLKERLAGTEPEETDVCKVNAPVQCSATPDEER